MEVKDYPKRETWTGTTQGYHWDYPIPYGWKGNQDKTEEYRYGDGYRYVLKILQEKGYFTKSDVLQVGYSKASAASFAAFLREKGHNVWFSKARKRWEYKP